MKLQRHGFTLFELLISIGLLVILSVVLLRVFVLTGDFWSAGDEQARLYADAKTALAMISEDLEGIVYNNTNQDDSDALNAPMWLEAYPYGSTPPTIATYTTYDGGAYGPFLHLITHTKWGSDTGAVSDICKVSYFFTPPTENGANRTIDGETFSKYGELARACTSDAASDTNYNLAGNRSMENVFPLQIPNKQTMITGVLDFRVYAFRDGDTWPVPLITGTAPGTTVNLSGSSNNAGNTLDHGAEDIKRVQIILTVMPPKRIDELRRMTDAEEQRAYIHKYARTFRKTIGIKEVE